MNNHVLFIVLVIHFFGIGTNVNSVGILGGGVGGGGL